jgi:hypothetical protein
MIRMVTALEPGKFRMQVPGGIFLLIEFPLGFEFPDKLEFAEVFWACDKALHEVYSQ